MSNIQNITLCCGLPASGKSSWAKKQVDASGGKIKRINKDDLRSMLDNHFHGKKVDKDQFRKSEEYILKVRDLMVKQALLDGCSVIVDDTNLSSKHFDAMVRIANEVKELGIECEVKTKDFIDVPVQECIKRDSLRPFPVGAKVILDMYNKYLKVAPPKYSPPVPDLPKVVIVDMDGTLSLMKDRNPYDASTADQDDLNTPVWNVLVALQYSKTIDKIIVFTAREEKYREPTDKFLYLTGGFDPDEYSLFMRDTGDNRKDSIVKKEMFYKYVHGKYNPILWIDDRLQVVDMVRHEIGLPVFQVNDGLF